MILTYVLVSLLVVTAVALVIWRAKVVEAAGKTSVFLGEVKSEIVKVTWPDRADLRQKTIVILVFCAAVAVLIGLLDIVLQTLLIKLPGRA